MAWQGMFKPKNPAKYKGKADSIVYRSRLEFVFMKYLDENVNVLEWASEEFFIPYYSPVDNKVHRYFPDMWVKKNIQGKIEIDVVEIKPYAQCHPPKMGKTPKARRRFINESKTYTVNQSKWKAAREFCSDRNWRFVVITEKELGIKF